MKGLNMSKFYTCLPKDTEMNKSGAQEFLKSAWCGEGYGTKKDANSHKKFFEEKFGVKFIIETEED
jgi:hypothetical protein